MLLFNSMRFNRIAVECEVWQSASKSGIIPSTPLVALRKLQVVMIIILLIRDMSLCVTDRQLDHLLFFLLSLFKGSVKCIWKWFGYSKPDFYSSVCGVVKTKYSNRLTVFIVVDCDTSCRMVCTVYSALHRETTEFNQIRAQHQRRGAGRQCPGHGGHRHRQWFEWPSGPRHFNSGCWCEGGGGRNRSSSAGTTCTCSTSGSSSSHSASQEEAPAGGRPLEAAAGLPGGLWTSGPRHLLHGVFSGAARVQGEQLPRSHPGVPPRHHDSDSARTGGHGCGVDQRLFTRKHKNSWRWDDLELCSKIKL